MNKSDVYFSKDLSSNGLWNIYKKIEDSMNGKIGIKVHFGEKGNEYYVKPTMYRKLVENLHAAFVETNVLYLGERRFTESHLKLAKEHGFGFAGIDILNSEDEIALSSKGKHYKNVKVGGHLNRYDSFVICSHFKGHALSGFGGAIKNVSMGFASVAGKMALHASAVPKYKQKKCTQCEKCLPECPPAAISINPVTIDRKKCIGCGKCIAICPEHVFSVPWLSTSNKIFMERMVEYAKAILQKKNAVYINILADISKDCDCMGNAAKPFVQDIGILGSTDIVAIEQASYDLVDKYFHSDDSFLEVNKVSGKIQIEYAHEIGLGNMKYKLIDIDN